MSDLSFSRRNRKYHSAKDALKCTSWRREWRDSPWNDIQRGPFEMTTGKKHARRGNKWTRSFWILTEVVFFKRLPFSCVSLPMRLLKDRMLSRRKIVVVVVVSLLFFVLMSRLCVEAKSGGWWGRSVETTAIVTKPLQMTKLASTDWFLNTLFFVLPKKGIFLFLFFLRVFCRLFLNFGWGLARSKRI